MMSHESEAAHKKPQKVSWHFTAARKHRARSNRTLNFYEQQQHRKSNKSIVNESWNCYWQVEEEAMMNKTIGWITVHAKYWKAQAENKLIGETLDL